MNSGDWTIKPEGSKNTARGRKRSPSGLYDSEKSTDGSIFSSHENKRKRSPSGSSNSERLPKNLGSSSHRSKRKSHYKNNSYGEFKKAKPPTFDGEVKSGQETKLGFLG